MVSGLRFIVGLLSSSRCGLLSSVWVRLRCWCMFFE